MFRLAGRLVLYLHSSLPRCVRICAAAGPVRGRCQKPAQSRSQDSPERRAPVARNRIRGSDVAAGRRRQRSSQLDSARGDRRRTVVLPRSSPCRPRSMSRWWSRSGPRAMRRRPSSAARWRYGPRPVPTELVDALLLAVDDDEQESPRRGDLHAWRDRFGRPAQAVRGRGGQLLKALDHYDPAVRAGAARVVGRLQVKSAGDALLTAVNDSNAEVRYASIRALGEIRNERAVQALTEQLTTTARARGRGRRSTRWRASRIRRACRCSKRG